jgi:hypothetical protein
MIENGADISRLFIHLFFQLVGLKEAIDENKLAITTKQKRIEELKLIKANLLSSNPHCQEVKNESESSHFSTQMPQIISSFSTENTTTAVTSQTQSETPNDNEGVFL